jgi:hypothetical protein
MSTVTTIIENQSDLNRLFAGVVEDFRALSFQQLIMGEFQLMAEMHQQYFLSATGPGGSKWPPLAASTIERKGHDTILVDEGDLVGSLNSASGGGNSIRETVDEWDGAGAGFSFGTGVPYSKYHTDRRPHVGVDDNYFGGLVDRSLDFVMEGLSQ